MTRCEDCGEKVRRRTRCKGCGQMICRWCFGHTHMRPCDNRMVQLADAYEEGESA